MYGVPFTVLEVLLSVCTVHGTVSVKRGTFATMKGAGGSRGYAPRHTTFDSVRCLCSRLCGDTFFTYLPSPVLSPVLSGRRAEGETPHALYRYTMTQRLKNHSDEPPSILVWTFRAPIPRPGSVGDRTRGWGARREVPGGAYH